jgi:hypothetical protein
MHFDYRGITSSRSRPIPASILELATNIITDWMPGTPNSLSRGFVDLLSTIIDTVRINGNDKWTLRPRVAQFEKQWKQVTSWILGVAFCKKIIAMEGYPWIAPVSAFVSQGRLSRLQFSYWNPGMPINNCRVTHPIPKLSRLMPDYVLARSNSNQSSFEISFAESKGCQKCLEFLNSPPRPWINQARNAQFYSYNVPIAANQHMLIATRINPKAKKPKKRRVYTRLWNNRNETTEVSLAAFRDIVLVHYFGVCERIGMRANAKLLALRSLHEVETFRTKNREDFHEKIEKAAESIRSVAREEIESHTTNNLTNEKVFIMPERSDFQLGERQIRVGLSTYGMEIIKWLQEGREIQELQLKIANFQEGINYLKSKLEKNDNLFVRSDGVLTGFIK